MPSTRAFIRSIARTKACQIRKFRGVIRQSTHHPVRCRLPHRVQYTTEDVKPDLGRVLLVADVDQHEIWTLESLAGVGSGITDLLLVSSNEMAKKVGENVPLIEERPNVNHKDHTEQNCPSRECARPSG